MLYEIKDLEKIKNHPGYLWYIANIYVNEEYGYEPRLFRLYINSLKTNLVFLQINKEKEFKIKNFTYENYTILKCIQVYCSIDKTMYWFIKDQLQEIT
jgi:hypothetical protein